MSKYMSVNLFIFQIISVFIIGIVIIGLILVILVIICLCVGCSRKERRPHNLSIAGIGVIPHQKQSTRRHSADSKLERKAIMDDSNSETSEETTSLPYVASKEKRFSMIGSPPPPPSEVAIREMGKNSMGTLNNSHGGQKDRSLTVMIPRAKYHPCPSNNIQNESQSQQNNGITTTTASICSTTEAKLLSYLDISPSADNERYNLKKKISAANQRTNHHDMPPGALVSAGFEVSATVGLDNDIEKKIIIHKMNDRVPTLFHRGMTSNDCEYGLGNSDRMDQSIRQSNSPFMVVNKSIHNQSNLADNMSDWLMDPPNDGYNKIY